MSTRSIVAGLVAGTSLCLALPAAAQTNLGFETGDLTGWSVTGPTWTSAASVVTSWDEIADWYPQYTYTPQDGNYFLALSAVGSCASAPNVVEQSFPMTAGQTIEGWAAFDAGDYWPYLDWAELEVSVINGANQLFYSSVAQTGDWGYTPWTAVSFTAPANDIYTISLEVRNVGDCGVDSAAVFDFAESSCADDDNDGVCNDADICDGDDAFGDTDGDEICDDIDVCVYDVENDADDDGICEIDDNCDTVANSDQINTDGDSEGDACDADDDNDGVLDGGDNCPLDANADQADFDNDGAGDVCDSDDDNDGVLDSVDSCPETALFAVVDADGCSIADICPCDNNWRNHGKYVSCVAQTAEDFLALGLITEEEKDATCSAAGQSSCGK